MFAEGYKRGDMYASFLVENSLTCVSNVYLTQNSSKDKLVSLVDIFLLQLDQSCPSCWVWAEAGGLQSSEPARATREGGRTKACVVTSKLLFHLIFS